MDTSKIEDGYYWVLFSGEDDYIIAEKNNEMWFTIGIEYEVHEEFIIEIGEKIERDK